MEGSTARLACRVMGVPEPAVHWAKDGQRLQAAGRLELNTDGGGHTLIIKDCRLEDAGHYSCEANNSAGTVATAATLTVQGGFARLVTPGSWGGIHPPFPLS